MVLRGGPSKRRLQTVCRMAGYVGPVIRPAEIVSLPAHSLYLQSYQPKEMQSGTVNADGYGAALWLDDGKPEPALYRTAAPIWADPNQAWMNERLRTRALLAAVRSATPGIGFELHNVQPFARGRVAFTHNGFVTGFHSGARRLICDSLGVAAYESIRGTSDSEHLFALVLDELDKGAELKNAVRAALRRLDGICQRLGRTAVATLLLSDGEQLLGCRWSRGLPPATLYVASFAGGMCMASEPLDERARFREVPAQGLALARPGHDPLLEALE